MTPGRYYFLYVITNKANGKQYVGQALNPKKRLDYHRWVYKRAKTKLGRAMRKHGIENFQFRVFCFGIPERLIDDEEKFLIYVLDTYRNGYNSTIGGQGSKGCPATPERKKKISLSKIGKPRSPETIEKMRIASTGKKCSAESREKRRVAMLGRFVSDETREKIGRIRRGCHLTDAQKEKLRQANLGKVNDSRTMLSEK